MFILREIIKDKGEVNTCLDVQYTLILKESEPDKFNAVTKHWSDEDKAGIYGIVLFDISPVKDYYRDSEYVDSIMPLREGNMYYIMTGNGQTFANISKR